MDLNNIFRNNSPRRVLSLVIAAAGVLLVLWLLMVMQMGRSQTPEITQDTPDRERLESVRTMREQVGSLPENDQRSSNMFSNALTTFVLLLLMLGAVWYWAQRKAGNTTPTKRFREVDHHILGPSQSIQILEINNEIWVLGVTGSAINLLHRYEADEWSGSPEPKKMPKSDLGNSFHALLKGKLS